MNWSNRLKLKRISGVAIVICFLISVLFAGFTIYGTQVGNFVVEIDNGDVSISLSKYEDMSNQTTRITVQGLKKQGDATYGDIPFDIYEGIGTKNDETNKRYMCFSFYLINNSERAVDYDFTLQIKEVTKNVDKALRAMVIAGEDEYREIFAAEETSQASINSLMNNTDYKTTQFLSDTTVCVKTVRGLEADGAFTKYTVVLWLEGWDEDCNNGILGSSIKMKMEFNAY